MFIVFHKVLLPTPYVDGCGGGSPTPLCSLFLGHVSLRSLLPYSDLPCALSANPFLMLLSLIFHVSHSSAQENLNRHYSLLWVTLLPTYPNIERSLCKCSIGPLKLYLEPLYKISTSRLFPFICVRYRCSYWTIYIRGSRFSQIKDWRIAWVAFYYIFPRFSS